MAPTQRDEKFQLRMTGEEREMLEALADRDGVSASDAIRLLIRRQYEALFGAEPLKRPKPKRK